MKIKEAVVHRRWYEGEAVYGAYCAHASLWTLHGSKPASKMTSVWRFVTCKKCLEKWNGGLIR